MASEALLTDMHDTTIQLCLMYSVYKVERQTHDATVCY